MMIQLESPDIAAIGLDELARRCWEDIQHYQQDGAPNAHSANGMELFRRAIALHDDIAWESIYDLYRGVVITWMKAFVGPGGILWHEQDELVNTAFGRFACAFTEAKLANCDSLSAILFYLKLTTQSTVSDAKRRRQARSAELSLDALEEEQGPVLGGRAVQYCEITDQVTGNIWAQDLWQIILEEIGYEDERDLLTLLYIQELKPAQVWHLFPWRFSRLEDVINMQRRIRAHLLKNPRIQSFLSAYRGEDEVPERPTIPPAAPAQVTKRRVPHTQSLRQAAPQVQDAPAGVAEDQRPPLATDAPVGVARPTPLAPSRYGAPAPTAPLANTSPGGQKQASKTRVTPTTSTSQAPRVPLIHYRLQKSFCGKARCKKCRDGQGHGPYWFAYQCRQGRTIRRYVGKTLPPSVSPGQRMKISGYE